MTATRQPATRKEVSRRLVHWQKSASREDRRGFAPGAPGQVQVICRGGGGDSAGIWLRVTFCESTRTLLGYDHIKRRCSISSGGNMYRCPQCHDLSISGVSTLFSTLNGATTCPTCMTALRIKRKPTNYLVVAYMCLRAILSSALPGGDDLGIFIETNVIIALLVIQFLLMEYEAVRTGTSRNPSKR